MENVARSVGGVCTGEEPELTARFARGEAGAFDRVVALYLPRVTALAHRLLAYREGASDVAQDVFLAAFEQAARFRAESSLWTWLAAITINRCRAHWRKKKLRDVCRRLLLGAPAGFSPAADCAVAMDETSAVVRAAVGELSPALREVVVLFYLEEMPTAEICRTLGLSASAVDVRLHRAREKLRLTLSPHLKD